VSGLWFRRKTYGWGWQPANAQGWVATILYVASVFAYPWLTRDGGFSRGVFLGVSAVLTAIYLLLCFKKGEKPRWQRGSTSDR
jgi:hypothetical protein